jgi:RimJ/RimL family protein N-acetyltransferase
VELRGGEVVLRSWRVEDAPAVATACRDPEIARWLPSLPSPYTDADARTYVEACVAAGDDRYPFAIADPESDRLLGSIDIHVSSGRNGHIGYWVAAGARGRGVCTAALRTLSRWALEELELDRLELLTDPDNRASQRVAEKVGFRREGVVRSRLRHRDGRRRDSVMFSLMPGELQ